MFFILIPRISFYQIPNRHHLIDLPNDAKQYRKVIFNPLQIIFSKLLCFYFYTHRWNLIGPECIMKATGRSRETYGNLAPAEMLAAQRK